MRRKRGKGLVSGGFALALSVAGLAASGAEAPRPAVRWVDGGVIDASPMVRARSVARAPSSASSLTTVPLDKRITTTDGTELAASEVLSFNWTSDMVGLLVYDEARPASGRIITVFEGPAGARPERPNFAGPSGGFVLPGSDTPVSAGTYRFQIAGSLDVDSAEVVLVPRRGAQPSSGTLDLNLFVLDGSELDTAILKQAVEGVFRQIFGQARIAFGSATIYRLTGAEDFLSLPFSLSADAPLRQLTAQSRLASNPMAYNLFFVREITGEDDEETTLGVSLGIPSALGIPGTISSGSVINVSGHARSGSFDVADFGQTMAHETAHSLGLWHTTEKDGSLHDTISDTPECAAAGDDLLASQCADGDNFLFWSGVGTKLTAGQAYVLVRSPIVK